MDKHPVATLVVVVVVLLVLYAAANGVLVGVMSR